MAECTCKPGKYEEGWQEERCEACKRAETEAFAQAIQNWRTREG